jgi:hypothetical protein
MSTQTLLQRGFSESDAAIYLGISRSTLRHGRSDGSRNNRMPPPPFVRAGRKIIYLRDDLDCWLAANRRDLVAPAPGRDYRSIDASVGGLADAGVRQGGGR